MKTGSVLLVFPFASNSNVAEHSTSQGAEKPQGAAQFLGGGKSRAATTTKTEGRKARGVKRTWKDRVMLRSPP